MHPAALASTIASAAVDAATAARGTVAAGARTVEQRIAEARAGGEQQRGGATQTGGEHSSQEGLRGLASKPAKTSAAKSQPNRATAGRLPAHGRLPEQAFGCWPDLAAEEL
jgi:hypothetical protein